MTSAELKAAIDYLTTGECGTNNDTDGPHSIAGVAPLTESGDFHKWNY